MRIGLDLDGVVVDSIGYWRRVLNREAGTNYTPNDLPDTYAAPRLAAVCDRHELEMLIAPPPVAGAVNAVGGLATVLWYGRRRAPLSPRPGQGAGGCRGRSGPDDRRRPQERPVSLAGRDSGAPLRHTVQRGRGRPHWKRLVTAVLGLAGCLGPDFAPRAAESFGRSLKHPDRLKLPCPRRPCDPVQRADHHVIGHVERNPIRATGNLVQVRWKEGV